MKKGILIVLAVVLAVCGICMICDALTPDTVDFRGYVDEIVINEDGNATVRATGVFNDESFTFYVGARTPVRNLEGERMKLTDVKAGDMIDVDYKGTFDNDTKSADARRVQILPMS